VYLVGMCIY
jgi:hypothetical protein